MRTASETSGRTTATSLRRASLRLHATWCRRTPRSARTDTPASAGRRQSAVLRDKAQTRNCLLSVGARRLTNGSIMGHGPRASRRPDRVERPKLNPLGYRNGRSARSKTAQRWLAMRAVGASGYAQSWHRCPSSMAGSKTTRCRRRPVTGRSECVTRPLSCPRLGASRSGRPGSARWCVRIGSAGRSSRGRCRGAGRAGRRASAVVGREQWRPACR